MSLKCTGVLSLARLVAVPVRGVGCVGENWREKTKFQSCRPREGCGLCLSEERLITDLKALLPSP